MKKIWIGAILSVAFVCCIFVYTAWENRRFATSLPNPPVVEQQSVDTHSHDHPHPHEDPVPETPPSNARVFDTQTILIENAAAIETSEKDTAQVDAAKEPFSVEESVPAWQTGDEHEHKSTKDPFGEELMDPSEMDPDEFADMILIGLLENFGDIPEVHTFMAINRKMFKNEEISLDEQIDFTRAQYHLWPDPRTKKALESFLEEKESNYPSSTQIVR